jgi:Arm DNA-binding domain
MGLGSAASVPLADARERAASARRKIALGLNPIDERKHTSGVPTFGEVAADVREALSAGFRNEKHKAQWKVTLETYAESLHAKPVDTIGSENVLSAFGNDLLSQKRRVAGSAEAMESDVLPIQLRAWCWRNPTDEMVECCLLYARLCTAAHDATYWVGVIRLTDSRRDKAA